MRKRTLYSGSLSYKKCKRVNLVEVILDWQDSQEKFKNRGEREKKTIVAGGVLQIVLGRDGRGESEDTSFIKLIDSLSEFLLVCVFRQHRTQETGQARERKINGVLRVE